MYLKIECDEKIEIDASISCLNKQHTSDTPTEDTKNWNADQLVSADADIVGSVIHLSCYSGHDNQVS